MYRKSRISAMKGLAQLRFEPELERIYEKETSPGRARELYLRGYVALPIYILFLLPDYFMIPDQFHSALIIRLGIMTPVIIAAMIFQRTNPPARIREIVESTVIFLAALSLIVLLSISSSEQSVIYHPGVSLILIFANLIVKLRLSHAAAVSTLTLVTYSGAIPFYGGYSPAVMVFNIVFMISSIIFSIIANYNIEKEKRKNYILITRERERTHLLLEENQELQTLTGQDALTGLPNRRAMVIYIQELLKKMKPEGTVGVILIDIDYFKKYNDTYGHQKGDECLKTVARTLNSAVLDSRDLVARYGGEEFIMIIPDQNADILERIARRAMNLIKRLGVSHQTSLISSQLTISCGLSLGTPRTETEVESLIGQADRALYRAKGNGRNQFSLNQSPG